MEEHTVMSFIAQYWQFVFLYVFKYLKDMNETLRKLEIDIAVIKTENETLRRRASDFSEQKTK